MQVERFLEESARRFPDKVALVCDGRRLTYRELDAAANRLACHFVAAGIRRGDRVAIYLENSVEAVLAVFATLKAGGVFMVVNATTKSDKLAFILNNSRAAMLITDGRHQRTLTAIGSRTPHTTTVVVVDPPGGQALEGKVLLEFDRLVQTSIGNDAKPANASIDIDLAALVYTSGSTGRPKGVMLTHLNIVSAAGSITTYLENSAADVILNVLPMSFDYGLYQVLMAFKVGATVVLERSFAYPHAVLEKITSEQVTAFPIVPTMSAQLLRMDLQKYGCAGLRYITNTAASWPLQHIRDLRRLLPDVKLYSMYGLTECKRVSYLPPDEVDTRPESVGRGMPNQELYVVDGDGNRLAHGVGELVIRGAHVMKGYWEMPEETERVLKPGQLPGERVLYSGDLFRIDEEGYLYFLGRMDDMIKTRGEKVSPREVENVLYELAGVVEAAVVGVADPVLGQSIKAVLTLEESASIGEQDVLRHCAERLETFMVPKIVEFRASMPKTTTGKIDKKTLHLALAN